MRLSLLVACVLLVSGCLDAKPVPETPTIRTPSTTAPPPVEEASAALSLVEVTPQTGVLATYQDGAEMGLYSILESLGGGVGMIDYDQDGQTDLFFPQGGAFRSDKQPYGVPSKFYRHNSEELKSGKVKFTDVSALSGGGNNHFYSHGCAVSDFDNDGFDDLLVTGYGGVQLFHNQGDGTFEASQAETGLNDSLWSSSAAWGDLNGDGANDLYVAHYVDWTPQHDPPCFLDDQKTREVCPPRVFQGLPDQLYLSTGEGGFVDPGAGFGDVSTGKGLGVAMADVDLDGDLDVYVTNDTVMNSLLVNESRRKLLETGSMSGTGFGDTGRPDGSMGVDIGDYNGDGLPDIWVTNYENETFAMYRSFDGKFFEHVSRNTGIAAAGGLSVGWGTAFIDLDLDGDEDLFSGNGHVIRHPTNSPVFQKPLVLRNVDFKRFEDVAASAGEYTSKPHLSRGVAAGDLDRDGDIDLVVSHVAQPATILENESARKGRWLEVTLIGTTSSRWAEGAWVEFSAAGRKWIRLKKGGTSYASASDRRIHLGVGDIEAVDLTIHWPSGEIQSVPHVATTQSIACVEGVALPVVLTE